ncbi:hypothetical protein HZH68_011500 [Vespula germanica]|uniref:Uncharacterized protein n=1 Tax=Vespula germanica TaxID=30212 RepID=A0A834JPL9_VESGE|nr:hypothetical protein HZH68_011500 [Vespula germanica]
MVLHEMVIFYEANLDRGSSASLCPPLSTHTYRRLRVLLKCHHMCDTLQPLASTADTDKGLALKQRRVKETEQNVSENVELSYTPDLTSDI